MRRQVCVRSSVGWTNRRKSDDKPVGKGMLTWAENNLGVGSEEVGYIGKWNSSVRDDGKNKINKV